MADKNQISFFGKVKRVLASDAAEKRIILYINKTPLRFIYIHLQKLLHPRLAQRRAALKIGALTDTQAHALQNLRTYGFTEVTELLSKTGMAAVDLYGQSKLVRVAEASKQQSITTKNFWLRLSDEDQLKDSNHPLVNISIEESVLNVIHHYLGSAPFLDYDLLTLSTPQPPEQKEWVQSQLWHFDRDNVPMLKMFIYLTDVLDNEAGPFTFINSPDSKSLPYHFANRHWQDEEVFKSISETKVIQVKRPKLSAFIVDTSRCLHMGSRLKTAGRFRLMSTSTYITLPSSHPWAGNRIYKPVGQLSERQRLALERF